jgi:hypothetical protein
MFNSGGSGPSGESRSDDDSEKFLMGEFRRSMIQNQEIVTGTLFPRRLVMFARRYCSKRKLSRSLLKEQEQYSLQIELNLNSFCKVVYLIRLLLIHFN